MAYNGREGIGRPSGCERCVCLGLDRTYLSNVAGKGEASFASECPQHAGSCREIADGREYFASVGLLVSGSHHVADICYYLQPYTPC